MAQPGYGEGLPEQRAAPDPEKKEDPLSQSNTPQTDVNMGTDVAAARDNLSEPTDKAASKSGSPATVTQTEKDYSTFSPGQKRFIIAMASLAGFFSPLSSSIYFPALSKIATDLHVSDAKVNLTVTTYLIIQGLAPMFVASISDSVGRRPAYVLCFTFYIAANLGLALENDYGSLLGLRCLQSAGSSGTISLANGVVGDLVTSSERGTFIAIASSGTILGPTLAPIIGGLLAQYLDWHWLFWFLLILAGAFAVPFLLFFPETCRAIVGDGSIPPPLLNSCLTDVLRRRKRAKLSQQQNIEKPERPKIQIPNPIRIIYTIADFETLLILLPAGLCSAVLQAVMTDASHEFTSRYHYNEIEVALLFIPLGVGGIVSILTTGKLVDKSYRRHANSMGIELVQNRIEDLSNFPIERARLLVSIPIFVLIGAFTIAYGWIMAQKVSIAGPVIVLFILGYGMIAVYQVLSVLLVDLHPGQAATASAANNLMRCELGAAFAAFISPMINGIGTGWSYTILALIIIITIPQLFLCIRYGMLWRRKKAEKKARKAAKRSEKLERAEIPREGAESNNV